MHLIRVGRRRINLEYLIVDEEGDGSPEVPVGSIRVTLRRGKAFILDGEDADRYRRQVDPLVLPDPCPADERAPPAPGGGPAKGAAGGRRVGRSAKRPLPPRPAEGGHEHGP